MRDDFDDERDDDYPEGIDADHDMCVDCPKCGARVYEESEKCPHCGEWIHGAGYSSSSPKRLIVAIIATILLILIASRWLHL